MTNQEAFDKMMEHLRSLKERSLNADGFCAYNGSKCAVGALMTDEELKEYGGYEGGVLDLLGSMKKSNLHDINIALLFEMQDLHDRETSWYAQGFIAEKEAKRIANRHGLTYTKP